MKKKVKMGAIANWRSGRPRGVEVQEAEREAEGYGDGGIDDELAEADGEVAWAEAEVEAYAVELADEEEAVDAGVDEDDLVEDGEVWGPCGFEPA